MATIYIDNKPYEVNPEQNLLHECLSLGFNLPYFCWHPAMGSVGSCRQCAVKQFKDEKDTQGKIVMACMTPASEGTRISIDDPEAKAFRASVIEWLMLNHPHDCPICDEGGECHLQDMTVMTGHNYRRTRFKKRTYRNQNLSPFINHEMNRCIQCYRCVRYYRDYAGGRDFDVFAAHDHVYFGRHEEGILENEFSGNLVEVCPTGVFTDKTLARHYTRKWDLQDAPSVCIHCGLGCNTSPRARYGMLRRIVNRYNFDVNNHFLCDRGRFGYEFVNSDRRLRRPQIRPHKSAEPKPVPRQTAIDELKSIMAEGAKVIGIGSPRASLEANFALRTLVGPEHFCDGMSAREMNLMSAAIEILRKGPARPASLHDVELSDAVLVLGEDPINTAPRLALALHQSIRQKPMEIADRLKIPRWHDYAVRTAVQREMGPVILATPYPTGLDDIATVSYRAAPEDLARLGYAIAHAVNPEAPAVAKLSEEMKELAQSSARMLADARRPLIISGTSCGTLEVLEAAANVASALCEKRRGKEEIRLCFSVPECNSVGMSMFHGRTPDDALADLQGKPDAIIVLENDLYRRGPSNQINRLLEGARILAIDSMENQTTLRADVLLPAGTFAESEGTLINNEGRAQRFFKVLQPEGEVQESWRWLRDIMIGIGHLEPDAWSSLDEVIAALEAEIPEFRGISEAAPQASYRFANQRIPRQLHRYSGRTAMNADVSVHEPAPPIDSDSPLSFSMEGYRGRPPAGLASFFWAPGWNSCQAVNKFQSEIGGSLRGGPAGVRLIEGDANGGISYFRGVPQPFQRRGKEFLIVPVYSIFGSEELSVHAPGIAERVAKPCIGINSTDAKELGTSGGEELEIEFGTFSRKLPAKLNSSLPRGVAILPIGLPGLTGIDLPVWGKIRSGRPRAPEGTQ
jgi:NADH-quinone oxidoreductase subunit G